MNDFVLPELKQIIGAMLFVRKEPLTVEEIRRVLTATAERRGGITSDFAKANEALIREAVDELSRDLVERKAGFHVTEVAGGWRLENDANCGPWLRTLLQKGRGTRLSLPALETLAIIVGARQRHPVRAGAAESGHQLLLCGGRVPRTAVPVFLCAVLLLGERAIGGPGGGGDE